MGQPALGQLAQPGSFLPFGEEAEAADMLWDMAPQLSLLPRQFETPRARVHYLALWLDHSYESVHHSDHPQHVRLQRFTPGQLSNVKHFYWAADAAYDFGVFVHAVTAVYQAADALSKPFRGWSLDEAVAYDWKQWRCDAAGVAFGRYLGRRSV